MLIKICGLLPEGLSYIALESLLSDDTLLNCVELRNIEK